MRIGIALSKKNCMQLLVYLVWKLRRVCREKDTRYVYFIKL